MFCSRQLFKDDPNRKTVNWAPFKAEWNPLKEFAHKRNWQKKYKQNRMKGDEEFYDFIVKSIYDTKFYKNNPNPQGSPSQSSGYPIWDFFSAYVDGYTARAPNHGASKLLDFCLNQGSKNMSGVEAAIWMLIACQEVTLVESGCEIGSGNKTDVDRLTIDLNQWTPIEQGGNLISTKRRVLQEIYERFYKNMKSVDVGIESKKRIFRENMSPEYLTPDAQLTLLTEGRIYSYIPSNIINSVHGKDSFKAHFNMLINFAEFFEYLQFCMLNGGLTPKEIVSRFTDYRIIKSKFYEDLDAYLK